MDVFSRFRALFKKSETPKLVETGLDALASEPMERRVRPRHNAREGLRVLVIDDSPTVCAVIRKNLRSAGLDVEQALDAEKGLAMVQAQPPDLIFLDIVLPQMNGFSALRKLRRNPASQDIPVIMISGNEQATEQFFAEAIGADDFMKKPFSRHEIFARIERLLDADSVPRRKTGATGHAPLNG